MDSQTLEQQIAAIDALLKDNYRGRAYKQDLLRQRGVLQQAVDTLLLSSTIPVLVESNREGLDTLEFNISNLQQTVTNVVHFTFTGLSSLVTIEHNLGKTDIITLMVDIENTVVFPVITLVDNNTVTVGSDQPLLGSIYIK